MRVTVPGYTSLEGKPESILQAMRDARLFYQIREEEFVEGIIHTAWRLFGITLQVSGDTKAERSESLLREMARNNMIEIEED